MKFSDLPLCACFVVVDLNRPSLLLVKDSEGNIRRHSSYIREEIPIIADDTEV